MGRILHRQAALGVARPVELLVAQVEEPAPLGAEAAAERDDAASPIFALTPGQASYLAADLTRLMDFIESEARYYEQTRKG